MQNISVGHKASIVYLILFIGIFSCSSHDEVIPSPEITVTPFSPEAWNDGITGKVIGINFSMYNVAVYAKVRDGWYTLPSREFPLIEISDDNNWSCKLDNYRLNEISECAFFLLPNGYAATILQGEKMIPTKLNIVAASKKYIQLKL